MEDKTTKVKEYSFESGYYPATLFVTVIQPYDIPVQIFAVKPNGHWTAIMRDLSYRGTDRYEVLRLLKLAVDKGIVNPEVTEFWGHVHPENYPGIGALQDWIKEGFVTLTPDKYPSGVEMLRVSVPIEKLKELPDGR